ncbi:MULTISPECIES: sigma-70 family RNA polymerase sigma factor [unclassified Staphylococcus]|uniref:sigma-70 family RNA polymerase sigma factor n=1 Tax=unclassified Staphylococcus TaxID=91994 RepID=UPI0021CF2FDC|nr:MULTISPECIES: sigma-70 family RNA polymerase sigma factor [unclassified Staphylococcus]UXR79089.1 sigma-70 family RNA polymerase sigma factor [Staphylococcus sp. IVB6227]UXR81814.1 sigma-70 family RNA polymerase sigma factor [Staphylococcus sp. IVB6214]
MNFDDIFQRYHKYIHYLLHAYHIRYHYDDYFQLMLIRLWELHLSFDTTRESSLHAFITYRLKYYLIDLLRKQDRLPQLENIDIATELAAYESDLIFSIKQWSLKLPYMHRHWLYLYLQGYTQLEIASILSRSPTSIKNYKKATFKALRHSYFNQH